jgi:DnaK suppressor protein
MEKMQLNQFKDLFTNILNEAALGDEQLSEALTPKNTGDVVDQAMGNRDQQLALKLQGRQGFFLKKVKLALTKIEDGSFGDCEECGGEISTGRLLARPTATQCITCKEEQEHTEQHIPYQKKSHTLGTSLASGHAANVIQLKHNDDGHGIKTAKNSLNL